MLDALTLYLDRLKGGHTQLIEGAFAPNLLEVDEQELKCPQPVKLRLEGYIAEEHLVLDFSASTVVMMPCAACNQMIATQLLVTHVVHTEPLSEVKGSLYDVGPAVREALLIELPRTVECNGGKCPQRETLSPYLHSKKRSDHFPFSDIDLKQ